MTDQRVEDDLRGVWDEIYRPAPWLLSRSMSAVRQARPVTSRRWVWLAGAVAVIVVVSSVAVFEELAFRASPTPNNTSLLPAPIPQPITRTSDGAQVAWVSMQSQDQPPSIAAIDATGRILATLNGEAGPYGIWRTPDGSEVFIPGSGQVTAYAASDGKPLRTYPLPAGQLVGDAFSPDGNWLTVLILNSDLLQLGAINLPTGTTQLATIERNSKANAGVIVFGGTFSPLYALTGWDTSMRLTALSLAGGKLIELTSGTSGEPGRNYPSCAGPAMPAWVIGRGTTLLAFCHADGAVLFFDLATLNSSGAVQASQPNPFWLSPILTPDGQLLYLHQWPAFGDTMQVVDLSKRRLVGPLQTPTRLDQGGLFAGLVTNVYAGGVASSEPISPDGLKLYSATADGVIVLRVPDLKPIAKLAPGFDANEVWVSGDGRTIYATSEDGKKLAVIRSDGSFERTIDVPRLAVGFIASEHG